ncbi:MAG: hypothetical protein M1823_000732 [Watsoniomyces obsoletus]|nr:MAG: hypothetical protein M1823_000732 [Watsoniomyces obsoletus]
MAQPTAEEIDLLLTRLSRKGGVQSTLILARDTGAIVRSSGLISASILQPSHVASQSTAAATTTDVVPNGENSTEGETPPTRAEEVAGMVWTFLSAAGGLVNGLNQDDDLKLLRLRTKKNELVIVPDQKFILVVIHDTPAA